MVQTSGDKFASFLENSCTSPDKGEVIDELKILFKFRIKYINNRII